MNEYEKCNVCGVEYQTGFMREESLCDKCAKEKAEKQE